MDDNSYILLCKLRDQHMTEFGREFNLDTIDALRAIKELIANIRSEARAEALSEFWNELHAEAETQYDRRLELLGPIETVDDAAFRKTLGDGWSAWVLAKKIIDNRHAAILADELKEREDTKTWSNYEIGMLAAMMTGDIEKDWATLATYLRDEPNDIPKCTRPLDMECHAHSGDNCYNGFQCDPISDEPNECEAEIGDIVAWANSQGKPIVGQYGNEITQGDAIILMRRSEVERKLKERDGLLYKSDVDDRGEG